MNRAAPLAVAFLVLAAAANAVQFADRAERLLARAGQVESLLEGPLAPADPAQSQALAWRSLPRLAAIVPGGARVLVVSGTPFPAQFELYFQPRPLAVLMPLETAMLERAAARAPELAGQLRRQFARLEALGLRLTPGRLAEELARADYVLLFLHTGPLPAAPPLERLAGDAVASLHRVVRG